MQNDPLSSEAITDQVRRLAEPLAQARGLKVFEVEYKRGGQMLRVYLDRVPGQVGLDDCQAVSQQLSEALDQSDLIPHAYRLEVSSPGLDRPLRTQEDFARFRGERAKLLLTQAVGVSGSLSGVIGECRSGMVRIEPEGGEPLWVPLSQLRSARLEPGPTAQPRKGRPGSRKTKQSTRT